MKKIFCIFFSIVFLSSWVVVMPDQAEEASAHFKAGYIYNFTKYIEWPEDYKQGSFVVGLLGTNAPLATELNKMAEKNNTKPENRKIEIVNMATPSEVSKCHIVYILPDNSTQLPDVITKIKNKSTLIVTDKPGLVKQGSGINFIIVENKLKFELNKLNIENHNLKVASALENLAVH